MRRSLKRNEEKHRKGGAFPHCAAAKPRWLIEARVGTGQAFPHRAAATPHYILDVEQLISACV
jgi:hypothetical protein